MLAGTLAGNMFDSEYTALGHAMDGHVLRHWLERDVVECHCGQTTAGAWHLTWECPCDRTDVMRPAIAPWEDRLLLRTGPSRLCYPPADYDAIQQFVRDLSEELKRRSGAMVVVATDGGAAQFRANRGPSSVGIAFWRGDRYATTDQVFARGLPLGGCEGTSYQAEEVAATPAAPRRHAHLREAAVSLVCLASRPFRMVGQVPRLHSRPRTCLAMGAFA